MYLGELQGEMGVGKPSVIKLLMNLIFHQRSKHIHLTYHSLRDWVERGLIDLRKVDSGLNAADMLTKHVGVGDLKTCKGLVV